MKKSSILKSFDRIQPVPISLPYETIIYHQLLNEYQLIHLLYHRNINQHRVARWWSSLDILHRHLRKILLLIEDIEEIRTLRRLSSIKWVKNKKSFTKTEEIPNMQSNRITKKVIDKKTKKKSKISKNILTHSKLNDNDSINLINKKLLLLLKECKYLNKQVIPSAYWLFMGIIELGQFANIGFTLIGLLARCWNLISKVDKVSINVQFQKVLENSKEVGKSIEEIEDIALDIGEAVDVATIEENFEQNNTMKINVSCNNEIEEKKVLEMKAKTETKELDFDSQTQTPKKKKKNSNPMEDIFGPTISKKDKKEKKKKKKAKNAMDEIFGF